MAKTSAARKKPASKKPAGTPRRAPRKTPARAGRRAPAQAVKRDRIEALTQVFAALGAQRPAVWARSHVDQGHDELGRFVLLRALWLKAVEPGRLLGIARNEPEVAAAAERLIKVAGLPDLDAVLRFAQKQALLDVCTVLDDPSASDEGIGWAVFRTDGRGLPLWALDRLVAGLTDSEPR
ncbi:MAG: hypothetical protein HYS27_06235 [Deltaproteobacteria bacterium]|nr:hypothetical protein [Deltaproteobacteria bacterium]